MMHWKQLDMRRKDTMPPIGVLAVLRLIPNNGRAAFCREEHEVGCFRAEGRKAWWHGSSGTRDPVKMRQHYDIWWCIVPEFDGNL